MKRILLWMAMAAIGLYATAHTPKELLVKELKLKNGMTVWLNEDHSQPKVYGAVVVKAGAADCPNTGIAHYFEHIMFKGTDKMGTTDYEAEKIWIDSISAQYDLLAGTKDDGERTRIQQHINRLSRKAAEYAIPNDFNNLIARYGGTALNAWTGYDQTVYHNTFAPQYIEQWAMLNSERLLTPVFRLFQGELETVYEEKNRGADNLFISTMEQITGIAFAGTPYEYPVIGSTENLKAPQLSRMRDFYRRYYVAGNMGLMLCGDIQPDSLMPLLERTFGRLPAGEAPAPASFEWKAYDRKTYSVNIPIPLVKAELIGFKGTAANSPDADALMLAMQLLNNPNHTGRLDSLMAEGKLLAAMAFSTPLKHTGFVGVGIVPNVLGKKGKAEDLCMAEIERLKRGEFSDEALRLVKQSVERERAEAMEAITGRAQLMVETFGNGMSWNEYMTRCSRLHLITKDDIVKVANKYLNNRYIKFVKRYGTNAKDRLSQPGYQPVIAHNTGKTSAFARRLAEMPVKEQAPRFIDFNRDATTTALAPLATLYTVNNPIDSLFSLSVTFHKGSRQDARLDMAEMYVEQLGTTSMSRLQLSQRLQQLGASITFSTAKNECTFTVKGHDARLEPTLLLLHALMTDMQPDDKKLKEVKKQYKVGISAFDKDAETVKDAMIEKLLYGNRAEALAQPTLKEVGKITSEELLQSVRDVLGTECTMVYSGKLATDKVAAIIKGTLHPERITAGQGTVHLPFGKVTENTVYIYRMKEARQNIIGTYQQLAATPTMDDVVALKLFATYFGSGMSSLMFQELREFRSFAYSAYGYSLSPVFSRHPDHPTAFITLMGTQTDKTLQALGVLDSMLQNMPVKEENMKVAKTTFANSISNSFPSFRNIGRHIAARRMNGYDHDINKEVYEALKTKTPADITAFYNHNVKASPRALFIIGNVSKDDMAELSKYGKVTELTKRDLINY